MPKSVIKKDIKPIFNFKIKIFKIFFIKFLLKIIRKNPLNWYRVSLKLTKNK